jgi:hypothetical protein
MRYVFFSILFLLFVPFANGCATRVPLPSISEEASRQAGGWAASVGIQPTGINCLDRDSDGDSYVSCTLVVKSDKGTEIIPLECHYFPYDVGCRTPKATVNGMR